MSSADCCCAMWQSPIQGVLRPAMWLPGIKNFHSRKETWIIPEATPDVCLEHLISAVAILSETEKMHINKVRPGRNFVQIFCYTEAEWLDVVEIEFQPGRERGTLAKARSFSTGLLPLMIPFAFLLNMIFFFVPFYDHNCNKMRLDRIKQHMKLNIEIEKEEP
ncbi:hypothetical protein OS493_004202 [Desmophyllum pertusum]|uniref:Uncharacterized protein n=1 Tax=Desmophyllum pertusum TaxID=174260 RepID=A0A9W9ZSP4_9CNID|nr:hypothetical protein OS493_004202 [Desmophyllum pertusum]